jgi:hypothetical protein
LKPDNGEVEILKMPTTDQSKPTGKAGRRNRKPEQRSQQSDPKVSPKSDKKMSATPQQQPESEETFATTAEPVATFSAEDEAAAETPISAAIGPTGLTAIPSAGARAVLSDSASMTEAAASDLAPAGLQAIADAYGDYTRKSLEQTRSFFERLARVRSLDKAVEVQVEFAKQAYETFVSEMQKICGLQTELAKQSFRPWEGFTAKTNRDAHQGLNGGGTRH